MADLIYDEMQLFGICMLLGAMLALVYDGVRIFRLLFCHRDWMVDVEDIAYWLFTASMVFRTLFRYNQGALRGYAFLGMFLGVIVYVVSFSKLLMYLVKKMLPGWDWVKHHVRRPFDWLSSRARKALKNMILEVKMAVKGR